MRQVALVTGSSRGIGFAAAQALAKRGFALAVNGPFDDEELRSAVSRLSETGASVMALPFDITDLSVHAERLAQVEAELGPLTTLVNNAGVGVLQRGDLLDVSEASWDRCLTVNTKALFFLSQAFAKLLLSRPRPGGVFHSRVKGAGANPPAEAVPPTANSEAPAAPAQ
ncbi:SDR family NAD(P)-dependent oxidoreductase, partial [Gluconobacter oxydans]|uniref:SDR family NAD(P)-dependent oxidoreductase n=1 Tax=Gluconobacter oxydans TaxID=442 RepID=UPI0039ED68BC